MPALENFSDAQFMFEQYPKDLTSFDAFYDPANLIQLDTNSSFHSVVNTPKIMIILSFCFSNYF